MCLWRVTPHSCDAAWSWSAWPSAHTWACSSSPHTTSRTNLCIPASLSWCCLPANPLAVSSACCRGSIQTRLGLPSSRWVHWYSCQEQEDSYWCWRLRSCVDRGCRWLKLSQSRPSQRSRASQSRVGGQDVCHLEWLHWRWGSHASENWSSWLQLLPLSAFNYRT